MVRLRRKHLPHKVDVAAPAGVTGAGQTWGTPVPDLPAYVEQKTRLVVDRRAESPTKGQEITSTTFVVMLPEHDVAPGSKVTVWKGTARERTSQVIDSAGFDYPRAPGHIELYLE